MSVPTGHAAGWLFQKPCPTGQVLAGIVVVVVVEELVVVVEGSVVVELVVVVGRVVVVDEDVLVVVGRVVVVEEDVPVVVARGGAAEVAGQAADGVDPVGEAPDLVAAGGGAAA